MLETNVGQTKALDTYSKRLQSIGSEWLGRYKSSL